MENNTVSLELGVILKQSYYFPTRLLMLESREDAYNLLDQMNAPEHLKIHVRLVGEATELLIIKLESIGVILDFEFIRTGGCYS